MPSNCKAARAAVLTSLIDSLLVAPPEDAAPAAAAMVENIKVIQPQFCTAVQPLASIASSDKRRTRGFTVSFEAFVQPVSLNLLILWPLYDPTAAQPAVAKSSLAISARMNASLRITG